MTEIGFTESQERVALRAAVRELANKYGRDYFTAKARAGEKTTEMWAEAGKLGYLGVAVPEEFGGGGGGIGDLAAVCEEFAAAGAPMLLMVVSPAICATVIARFGTEAQKTRWLPGFADGTTKMAFSITEPDAFIAPGYPKGIMPTTFGALGTRKIDDLVAFVASGSR